MKKLSIIALFFAVISLSTGIYHAAETHPNEKAFHKRMDYKNKLSRALWISYAETSDVQGIVIGVSGILGFVMGLIGFIKERSAINMTATGAALIGLVIVLATKTHLFS